MVNSPLAVALALFSTFGFGAAFVLTQFALRWMPPRVGGRLQHSDLHAVILVPRAFLD